MPTPVAQAAPAAVRSGEIVRLDGSTSSGAISVSRWAQSAGPRVLIADADSLVTSFVAPPVAAPTVVTIALVLISPCRPPPQVAEVDVTILPPPGVALIAVEPTIIVAGEEAGLEVRLRGDLPVASVAHDLTLGSAIAIVAAPDGRPQCAVPAELGDVVGQFEFTPAGCSVEGCTGIHAEIGGAAAIPDGALLYRCSVAAAGSSPVACGYPYDCCDHLLACDDASAAGATDAPLPAQCVEGVVGIRYPQASAEFVFTVDPPAPRVGDLVHVTVDTVRRSPGLIGRPVYSLRGAEPFFTGDTSRQYYSGVRQVTYELQAVRAGTAELSIAIAFEAQHGWPGNEFYGVDSLNSAIFPVTIAAAACSGDCDADGRVAIDEVITGVRIALGDAGLTACPAMDGNGRDGVRVDDLVAAVRATLYGCAAGARQARTS